jgi:ATP-dependent DNA helicase 2 subunit 2
MFLIDTSPSMSKIRTVDLPPGPNGEELTTEMTNLEWALQFVKLKIQEMVHESMCPHISITKPTAQIFNGRKTDQCGVIVFGSEGQDQKTNIQFV